MSAKKSTNPIQPKSILKWTLIAVIFGGVGLHIVYLKNQQFQLGQKIRQTEQAIREIYLNNQVLLAEIVMLSSRSAIQKNLASLGTQMIPIEDRYIARFSILEITQDNREDTLRTASTGSFTR